jgi:hypothetical protein
MRTVPWMIDTSQKDTELLGRKLPHWHFFQKFHIGSHMDKTESFMVKERD